MSAVTRLNLTGRQYDNLRAHLFPGDGKEAAAIALCGRRDGTDSCRLVVQSVHPVPYAMCTARAPDVITWPVEWLDPLLEKAERYGLSVVKFHSHPTDYRRFSATDDVSDARLFIGIHAWIDKDVLHGSVVMLPDGTMFGRTVDGEGAFTPITTVAVAGDDIAFWHHTPAVLPAVLDAVGRKTPAFGQQMTAELARLSVAVIGCSGTGSIVIEQLARLGIGRLVLVDPEKVERKNLNRVVNATARDAEAGITKVELARRSILAMGLGTVVEIVTGNLVDRDVVEAVAGCDVLFGCVDSAEGRDLLNRISSHYLLPFIDVGVGIVALPDGSIDQINGVVHYIQPGGSSLLSREAYRVSQVTADALRRRNPALYAERLAEKYIAGADEEAPAVISVNMTMASLAVNELLARIYRFRNQPNRHFAITRISLTEMEFEYEEEGTPCPVFAPGVGAGDIDPPLNLAELSLKR